MTYKIGSVYMIEALNGSDEVYVGSTIKKLNDRFSGHKCDYIYYLNGEHHFVSSFEMFDMYGLEGCKITLIKEYQVADYKELKVYEQMWLQRVKRVYVVLNQYQACGLFPFFKKERNRQYHENNRDRLNEYARQYSEENRDRINEYARQYREENRNRINDRGRQKIPCSTCGKEISRCHMLRHKRLKHPTQM